MQRIDIRYAWRKSANNFWRVCFWPALNIHLVYQIHARLIAWNKEPVRCPVDVEPTKPFLGPLFSQWIDRLLRSLCCFGLGHQPKFSKYAVGDQPHAGACTAIAANNTRKFALGSIFISKCAGVVGIWMTGYWRAAHRQYCRSGSKCRSTSHWLGRGMHSKIERYCWTDHPVVQSLRGPPGCDELHYQNQNCRYRNTSIFLKDTQCVPWRTICMFKRSTHMHLEGQSNSQHWSGKLFSY